MNTLGDAERWAADIGVPAYAIDDQTAIKVVGGSVEVVSEGRWTQLGSWPTPQSGAQIVGRDVVDLQRGTARLPVTPHLVAMTAPAPPLSDEVIAQIAELTTGETSQPRGPEERTL